MAPGGGVVRIAVIPEAALSLPPVFLKVFVGLALHANRDGLAWPSVAQLMKVCGLSESSVRRGLRQLCLDGLIEKDGYAKHVIRYRITCLHRHLSLQTSMSPQTPVSTDTCLHRQPKPVSTDSPNLSGQTPVTAKEQQKEQINTPMSLVSDIPPGEHTRAEKVKVNGSSFVPPPFPAPAKKPRKRFVPPSYDEVAEYFAQRGCTDPLEVDVFMGHYESNDWKVGKNKMVSWRGAAGKWVANWKKDHQNDPWRM